MATVLPSLPPEGTLAPGRKFDGGKLRFDLIPPHSLEEMVKVLTHGAEKYAPDNWRHVPDAKRRYFAALERHLWAWKRGETIDPDSGIHHLAHAACNLFFLYEHDVIWSAQGIQHINIEQIGKTYTEISGTARPGPSST
jgi:hypothetical protein